VHRLLAVDQGRLLTRGDALPHHDPVAHAADVIARVVGHRRRGQALAWRRAPHLGQRVGQWLFRRSGVAARLYLRWQRMATRLRA
jgi:hypothetical protein